MFLYSFCVVEFIPITASVDITGFESLTSDYLQLPLSLDELLVKYPSATFIGKVYGNSMEGIGIFNGDILIVDRHVTVKYSDVIVANFNDEFICKILSITDILLLSANYQYPAITIIK